MKITLTVDDGAGSVISSEHDLGAEIVPHLLAKRPADLGDMIAGEIAARFAQLIDKVQIRMLDASLPDEEAERRRA